MISLAHKHTTLGPSLCMAIGRNSLYFLQYSLENYVFHNLTLTCQLPFVAHYISYSHNGTSLQTN